MATSRRYTAPASWLAASGQWPGGPFKPGCPRYALKTAQVVERLEATMLEDGRSARQVALAAEIDPGTLSRLRSGQAVPDLATLDALERVLGADLWGGRAKV
ncbi:MAG: helix-turn-helix transcriptional regulator [Candidatus Nanopelagicales bacterium]